jgi:hypothetical protein
MSARLCFWMLALSSAAIAAPLQAQIAPVTKADSALMSMRGALRWVATAQESHLSRAGAFASTLDSLRQDMHGPVDPLVRITILRAAKEGWAGEATHPDLPGKSCIYWLGPPDFGKDTKTALEKRTSARPGRVLCDSDPS